MTTSDRVFGILDLFTIERPDWSVEEAVAALGLATSTAYRYFASLTAMGLLAPYATGRYVLGPTIIRYDRQLRLTDPLISAVEEHMKALAALRPEQIVVFLCRLIGRQVMCVHQAAVGVPPFAVSYERGRLMPLFAGSASKAILANLASRQTKALYAREEDSFVRAGLGTSWEQVRASLRRLRGQRVLVTHGEVDPGMLGMSVPLVIDEGRVLASLNIAGPERLMTDADVGELEMALLAAKERVVADLRDHAQSAD